MPPISEVNFLANFFGKRGISFISISAVGRSSRERERASGEAKLFAEQRVNGIQSAGVCQRAAF